MVWPAGRRGRSWSSDSSWHCRATRTSAPRPACLARRTPPTARGRLWRGVPAGQARSQGPCWFTASWPAWRPPCPSRSFCITSWSWPCRPVPRRAAPAGPRRR
ncbi:hypothetical protein F751_0780 [Auxenochlorella protothecoides]|uniref:Uncharacterized protein n=1 Tax=Auxenochlorella protothecoides TaxID=3075 RepID=A0A087SM94_AUXPR|nr:hypothetical protein F751_0780 [Auxenochlorella protothecoides]KFM26848.1 hypothetical protein F751_0780 [Auxenochlorella protothecoides]